MYQKRRFSEKNAIVLTYFAQRFNVWLNRTQLDSYLLLYKTNYNILS